MECPICKFEMERGHASVHGTLIGVLLFGMSREHLWFQGDQSKHRLLKSKNGLAASHCSECGTLVMPDPDTLIDNATTHVSSGDIDRARRLYRVAIDIGIELGYCQQRIAELDGLK